MGGKAQKTGPGSPGLPPPLVRSAHHSWLCVGLCPQHYLITIVFHAHDALRSLLDSPGCIWTTATWVWAATTAGAPRVRNTHMPKQAWAWSPLKWLLLHHAGRFPALSRSQERRMTYQDIFPSPCDVLQCTRSIWCPRRSMTSACCSSRSRPRAGRAAAPWRQPRPHGEPCCEVLRPRCMKLYV